MTNAAPAIDPSDLNASRSALHAIHNELRNLGLNPVEAAAELALRVRRDAAEYGLAFGDTLATAFQQFLTAEARAGLGQYFTPGPVCDAVAEFARSIPVAPESILDPFCGAGLMIERVGRAVPGARLYGIEINQAVAEMALTLEAVSHQDLRIVVTDSFARWADGGLVQADFVATNPPFGATVTSQDLLDAGSPLPQSLRSMSRVPAELAGLEVAVAATAPGGYTAAVLPWSVLSNTRWGDYRSDLFSRVEVVGAVGLPDATFAPFRGVARSFILFLRNAAAAGPVEFPWTSSLSVGYDANGRPGKTPDVVEAVARMRSGCDMAACSDSGVVSFPASAVDRHAPDREYVRLGSVAEVFTGNTPPKKNYGRGGPFVLKVGDLDGAFVPWRSRSSSSHLAAGVRVNPAKVLEPGDVCLTSSAHRSRYIGLKVDLLDEIPDEGAVASAEVMVIRSIDPEALPPESILHYLRSAEGYRAMQAMVRGSTAHLYPKDMLEMQVPLLGAADLADLVSAHDVARAEFRSAQAAQDRTSDLAEALFGPPASGVAD